MIFDVRPMSNWPGKKTDRWRRRRAVFRASYDARMDLLERECEKLGATQVIIEAYFRDQDIRLDGKPRAGARPAEPGVVISFESKHGPLRYPCDHFDDWQDNAYAVAKTLERLRQADLYGVTRHGEQYRGWKQLPGPEAEGLQTNLRSSAVFVAAMAGRARNGAAMTVTPEQLLEDTHLCRRAAKVAAMVAHPDAGGSDAEFMRLQEAKRVLGVSS